MPIIDNDCAGENPFMEDIRDIAFNKMGSHVWFIFSSATPVLFLLIVHEIRSFFRGSFNRLMQFRERIRERHQAETSSCDSKQ